MSTTKPRLISINLTEYNMLCETREEYLILLKKLRLYENLLRAIDGAVDGMDSAEDSGATIPAKDWRNLCHEMSHNARDLLSPKS